MPRRLSRLLYGDTTGSTVAYSLSTGYWNTKCNVLYLVDIIFRRTGDAVKLKVETRFEKIATYAVFPYATPCRVTLYVIRDLGM